MKPNYISEIEELNLEGWRLKEDTATYQIYEKNGMEKHLQIYDNYMLEENYTNEKLNGILIGRMRQPFFHYPNYESKIYMIENYKEGMKDGFSEDFYEDGARVRQEWKNDTLNGKWEQWFGNGQKEEEKNYSNGKLNGEQYKWYENGQLKLKEKFIDGLQVDESEKYLENGKLKRRKGYKNGKIEGVVYELWDFNGQVIDGGIYNETEYVEDVPNGKETVFYPNGKIMREGIVENGIEIGERTWFNSNGTISIKEYYINGELDGDRFIYDENGNLESTQEYSNGERIR